LDTLRRTQGDLHLNLSLVAGNPLGYPAWPH